MQNVLKLGKCLLNPQVNRVAICTRTVVSNFDSIFALSSGTGKCGVAVIRLSGPHTQNAMCTIMKRKFPPKPRYAVLSNLYNKDNEMLDKALVLWFPKPHSFTGEDVCELHVHGGTAVIASVFKAIGEINGFRPAEPGDYTKRAFFNEKLDLTEVEGLGDLIHSETEAQRRQALRQMGGSLSQMYIAWKDRLLKSLSHVEAYIDFAEDQDIDESILETATTNITGIIHDIKTHLNDNRRGERLRQGVHMTIIGSPNVGKSSLLNEISQRPAAIVSEIPGTTRDIVESTLDIGGYPVIISDTAGIRETSNPIEREGVSRAWDRAKLADLLIIMFDLSDINLNNVKNYVDEILNDSNIESENLIVIFNKIDLMNENKINEIKNIQLKLKWNSCVMSCKNGEGFSNFMSTVANKLKVLCEGNSEILSPSITQERHRFHIKKCLEHLEESTEHADCDIVIAAEYMRLAIAEIGRITGKIGAEDILDVIFKDFCIGK